MNNKTYLVLTAHGSRSKKATQEIQQFTAHLSDKLSDYYRQCKPAFLEMSAPSMCDCITDLVAEGAETVHVLPYFLTSGVHVTRDIPAQVEQLRQRFPELTLTLLPAIGLAPQMMDVVETVVTDTLSDMVQLKPVDNCKGVA